METSGQFNSFKKYLLWKYIMIQVKLFKIHEFKGSNNYRSNIQAYFFLQAAGFQVTIKCAEATCVDIATEMKNALD